MKRFLVFIPFIIFTVILLPFINLPPCWDAGTEFSKTGTIQGRFHESMILYMKQGSLHPPFKFWVSGIFYALGGKSVFTYHWMGIMIGYIGILSMFLLGKSLKNKETGLIAATLLATFPLFVANATDNYTDYFAAVFIILSLYVYSANKVFLYIFAATAATLSKDTGVLLPISVFFVELFLGFFEKNTLINKLRRLFLFALPISSYFLWYVYIKLNGFTPFNDYIFAATGNRGAIITILSNLLTFNFFHQYAQAHFLQLIYLNFNWVYILIIVFGFLRLIKTTKFDFIKKSSQNFFGFRAFLFLLGSFLIFSFLIIKFQKWTDPLLSPIQMNFNGLYWIFLLGGFLYTTRRIDLKKFFVYLNKELKENPPAKTSLAMALFFVLFTLTVITFQVWQTPRYNLPLIPILIITASLVIAKHLQKIPFYMLLLLSAVNFIGLYFSWDPISRIIWDTGSRANQTVYTIDADIIGNDALVYNLQYLLIMKKRSDFFGMDGSRICNLNN